MLVVLFIVVDGRGFEEKERKKANLLSFFQSCTVDSIRYDDDDDDGVYDLLMIEKGGRKPFTQCMLI